MVSKTADLLTEWVFERDLVSKMPHLLTEWVFEGDLVSKMADLLTEKGIRCATTGLLRKHCASEGATITPTRLASRGRECPRRGLGGFVGLRQLPHRPDECDRLAKIDWASGSERPTRVTAENLRSRRPGFWPAHEAHAPLARKREWSAEELPHAKASRGDAVRG